MSYLETEQRKLFYLYIQVIKTKWWGLLIHLPNFFLIYKHINDIYSQTV